MAGSERCDGTARSRRRAPLWAALSRCSGLPTDTASWASAEVERSITQAGAATARGPEAEPAEVEEAPDERPVEAETFDWAAWTGRLGASASSCCA